MSGIKRSPKRLLVGGAAILVLVVVVLSVSAYSFRKSAPPSRSGVFHGMKDCSMNTGRPGGYCTVTASSLDAIKVGSKVVYLEAAGAKALDSDVVLYVAPGNVANGHCYFPFPIGPGRCTFSGGRGSLTGFHATFTVKPDPTIQHQADWDGPYSFSP
jgi:hypothetical protein